MFTETSLVALPATVAQSWLVLNLVPVSGDEATIGTLPMLPALLFGWVLVRRVYRSVKDRVSMLELQLLALCTVGIPVLLTLTASAMLYDASSVLPVQPPSLGEAIVRTLVMHLCVLGFGMGPRLWRALARRIAIPSMIVDAALYALTYLKALAAVGVVTVLVSLAFHWENLRELMQYFSTPGGAAGVVLLSVLYLPNAAIFAAAILLGSEFHISDASVSLFSAHLVPLPPLPLFAAVPASVVSWAWVLLLVPCVVAAILAYRRMGASEHPIGEFIAAGGFAMLFAAIAVYLAGGTLGVFGDVGSLVWLTSSLALLILTGTSVLAVVVHRVLGPKSDADDDIADDADDDEFTVEEPTEDEQMDESSEEVPAAEDAQNADNIKEEKKSVAEERQVDEEEQTAEEEQASDNSEAESETAAEPEPEAVAGAASASNQEGEETTDSEDTGERG